MIVFILKRLKAKANPPIQITKLIALKFLYQIHFHNIKGTVNHKPFIESMTGTRRNTQNETNKSPYERALYWLTFRLALKWLSKPIVLNCFGKFMEFLCRCIKQMHLCSYWLCRFQYKANNDHKFIELGPIQIDCVCVRVLQAYVLLRVCC